MVVYVCYSWLCHQISTVLILAQDSAFMKPVRNVSMIESV